MLSNGRNSVRATKLLSAGIAPPRLFASGTYLKLCGRRLLIKSLTGALVALCAWGIAISLHVGQSAQNGDRMSAQSQKRTQQRPSWTSALPATADITGPE